jgi:hypothetical protein
LIVEKHRTLWEKLSGANRLEEQDEFIALLKDILASEPNLQFVGVE